MQISGVDLAAEYERAARDWPFIAQQEAVLRLPPFMLFAVGSRETNLTNEVGDGGHGHGVWQLDDRSHTIPPGFDADVRQQCEVAGGMLAGLLLHFGGNQAAALAAYNAGTGTVESNIASGLSIDSGTANGNYSADTLDRMAYLRAHYTINRFSPEVPDMYLVTANNPQPELPLLVEGRNVWLLQEGDALPYEQLGVPQKSISPAAYTQLRSRSRAYNAP